MKHKTQWECVGDTPLLRISSLSDMTGCHILAKAEFLNPGGSIKDRAAKGLIMAGERQGALKPGGHIVEGTAGNTGIGLATLGIERGYKVTIFMPDNQAPEKIDYLKALGVDLKLVPPCPFKNENHFYHQAKRFAQESGAFWTDQFENTANASYHEYVTGPEIRQQCPEIDFLTLASGTGGTIGGISSFFRRERMQVQIVLADPQGSAMASYIKCGELQASGSSITEGIGTTRVTQNFSQAHIDDAYTIPDQEMVNMAYWLAQKDGLAVGPSSGLNVASAFRIAKKFRGSGKQIVTFLCDHGSRYASRFYDPNWLLEKGLKPNLGAINLDA